MDIVPTKMKNTIATHVSINSYDKKIKTSNRLLYFAHNFISDRITINNYYYLPSLFKT